MSTNDERRPLASRREDRTADALSPEEARFVSRVADVFQPPEPTAVDRVRFQARLEDRLARGTRQAAWRWLAPATLALAVALLVTAQLREDDVAPTMTARPLEDALGDAEEETLLALVAGDVAGEEPVLPEDYQAIASLMY